MGYGPIYDWSCQLIEKNTKNDKDLATKTIAHEEKCPVRCHELKNCGDCLSSSGSEGKDGLHFQTYHIFLTNVWGH